MNDVDRQREDLARAFELIPQLAGSDRDTWQVTPLPGFTNRNYRLQSGAQDWVLRVPRQRTNRLIDRLAEAHNQNLACQLGLAPAAAWCNRTGMSLTATLAGTRNPVAADFDSGPRLQQVATALRRLHDSDVAFEGGLSLENTLRQHYALLAPEQQAQLALRMDKASRILALMETRDLAPVPSHRDPVAGNLLFEDDRLWLIDWEYSAMASPYWDLAILCNDANLDLQRSRRLLRAYCADGRSMQESLLFDYRGLLKLLNDCWMAAFTAG